MTRTARPAPTRGFSLVELLVAMTLGLLVIAGAVSVFAGNKRSSDISTAMADLQETARFALGAIARDARMAGFQGCIDINKGRLESVVTNPPTSDLRLTAAVGAVVNTATDWSPALPGFIPTSSMANAAVPGTHVLALQFGGPVVAGLDAQMQVGSTPSPNGNLQLDTDGERLALTVGDYAVISNCDTGDLFRVTGVSTDKRSIAHAALAGANSTGSLTRAYGDLRTRRQTMVMRFSANIYFVGETGLSNDQGDPIRGLYRQSLPYSVDNPPVELVQGVENLRVAFGVRNSGGTLSYVQPGASGYVPGNIESIQLGLLMASWDAITDADDTRTYVLAGQPIHGSATGSDADAHPSDRRMRLVFNTTVRVRNRRNGS